MPPLSSPQSGPPHISSVHHTSPGVTYAPQEEDTVRQSRPRTDTSLGLPPSVFKDRSNHRSAIHRLHQSLTSRSRQVFRCLRRLVINHQPARAVAPRPSRALQPALERTASQRARCGQGACKYGTMVGHRSRSTPSPPVRAPSSASRT